jgi:hypothetical protein
VHAKHARRRTIVRRPRIELGYRRVMRKLAVILLVLGLGTTAWAKPKIAILGLEVVGTADKDTVRIADELTAALRARPASGAGSYEPAPAGARSLADEKKRVQCQTELPACMSKLGAELGADFLLYGKLEKRAAPAGYQVSLRLLKVASKSTVMAWTSAVPPADTTTAKLGELAASAYQKLTGDAAGAAPKAPPPRP